MNRIWRFWKTSLVALAVIMTSLVLVWFEKATLMEVAFFLATGFLGFFAKDPKVFYKTKDKENMENEHP